MPKHFPPFESLFRSLFIISLLFLVFMAGGISTYYKWPPYQWIHDANVAQRALEKKEKAVKTTAQSKPLTRSKKNPIIKKTAEAYKGYTLFSAPGSAAELLNANGKKVHRWELPFSALHIPRSLSQTVPDNMVQWKDLHMFPNGDLLATYEAVGVSPYGYGLARIDKNSKLIWKYPGRVNHRFDIGPDGKIYALVHEIANAPVIPGISFKAKKVYYDYIVILDSQGKELKKLSLMDAFSKSSFKDVLKERALNSNADLFHSNSVILVTPETAKLFPQFKPGQLLVSLRNMQFVGILDTESEKFVWRADGPWHQQHDAEFVKDGSIMIFDNQGSGVEQSRILKYYPDTKRTTIVYGKDGSEPFFTSYYGMQQQLPNGNILIVEVLKGRAFEVNPKGEVVWEFTNPYHGKKKPAKVITLYRIPPEDVKFLH